MIDTFKATETKLYVYFDKDKKINSINKRIELLNKQIADIERHIKEIDIKIPEESRAISYEERVQTSSDGTSYAEKTLLKITDNLLKEVSWKREEVELLEKEKRDIYAYTVVIENNIGDIKEEAMKFLELKYRDKNTDWQIGMKLGMDQSTVTRTKNKLLLNIAQWEWWNEKMAH